jgi:hypothetical protein
VMEAGIKAPKGQSWPHWTTPECVLERVRRVGRIVLDPCSNPASTVDAAYSPWREFVPSWDGLEESWYGHAYGGGRVAYVNPPYGTKELPLWVDKMVVEAARDCEIVALLPARTSTRWFQKVALTCQALHWWGPGRIAFGNPPPWSEGNAPSVESLLAYWGPNPSRFLIAFAGAGHGFVSRDPALMRGAA